MVCFQATHTPTNPLRVPSTSVHKEALNIRVVFLGQAGLGNDMQAAPWEDLSWHVFLHYVLGCTALLSRRNSAGIRGMPFLLVGLVPILVNQPWVLLTPPSSGLTLILFFPSHLSNPCQSPLGSFQSLPPLVSQILNPGHAKDILYGNIKLISFVSVGFTCEFNQLQVENSFSNCICSEHVEFFLIIIP
jgi:hypothetical protein